MYSSPLPPPHDSAPASSLRTRYNNAPGWSSANATSPSSSSASAPLRELPPAFALPPPPSSSSPTYPVASTSGDEFVPRQPRRSSLLPALPGHALPASINGWTPPSDPSTSTASASVGSSANYTRGDQRVAPPVIAPLKIPSRPIPGASSAGTTAPSPSTAKRANPLEDLIFTEQLYVDDLSVIIKRVAAAWSRANFPPPALDAMFRTIEAVYRINKSFLTRLNEIGPNPSSPKALGDLLMRWIDDLSPAYTRYASTYSLDFDLFEPVQSNAQLAPILAPLSWPNTLPQDEEGPNATVVTLDGLFLLPLVRLGYYKRLYAKLLRSTVEGRSDHALLVGANEQLDRLLVSCEEAKRRSVVVEQGGREPTEEQRRQAKRNAARVLTPPLPPPPPPPAIREDEGMRSSGESGTADTSFDMSARSSSATGQTSVTNDSSQTHTLTSTSIDGPLSPRIEDLERRLNTSRALDIFTMTPKKCKLQMAPPSLPFSRSVRRSGDVAISFYPQSDPQRREVVIERAYMFLLTDLFLVCQRMTPQERIAHIGDDGEGPDFWLMYPPLAGKHLRVARGLAQDSLDVTIMKKETLSVRLADATSVDEWKEAFEDAIEFGAAQPPSATARSNSVASQRFGGPSPSPTGLPGMNLGAMPRAPVASSWRDMQAPGTIPSPTGSNGFPSQGESPARHDYRSSPDPMSNSTSSALSDRRMPPMHNLTIDTDRRPETDRRAFSAGGTAMRQSPVASTMPSFPLPPPVMMPQRGMPNYGGSSPSLGGHSPSRSPVPNSPAFPPSTSSRGPSPIDQYGGPPSGRYSPHHAPPNGGFGDYGAHRMPPLPPTGPSGIPNRLVKSTSSSRSNDSTMSSGTNHSSMYPDPPPLPNKRMMPNNGMSRSTEGSFGQGGMLGPPPNSQASMYRSRSADGLRDQRDYRLPSVPRIEDRTHSAPGSSYNGFPGSGLGFDEDEDDEDVSEPGSPVKARNEQTAVIAQMRCKVFLQHGHGQWKSLGTAKLKLFLSKPSHTKQLVVDSDKSGSKTIISTIVLTDGVERVGKTGVAIDLSDNGHRTGIIYMLQMKTEQAATGLFDQFLVGSDRAKRR